MPQTLRHTAIAGSAALLREPEIAPRHQALNGARPDPAEQGPCALPTHVGIIMDGNRRWAQSRNLSRRDGHKAGVEALRKVVRHVGDSGIRYLTLFAFSSENWKRPPGEVRDLLTLLRLFIERDLADLKAHGVKVRILGDRDSLAGDVCALVERAETVTAEQSDLFLNIAFNYGGRDEIVRAARKLAAAAASGAIDPHAITLDQFTAALDTAGQPDPDLIIRTSGELRLSNFLLWQAAYAEFVFTPTLWPDFDDAALDEALATFAGRQRRFGGQLEPARAATA